MLEVFHRDLSVVVRVENFERIDQILQRLLVLSAVTDNLLDILAGKKSGLLGVHLLRHILDLSLSRVQVESTHKVSEFGRRDLLLSLRLIKQLKNFLDFI